jgi:hypothetical protein
MRQVSWVMVGVLLWAVAVTIPRLDYDSFSHDEIRTLVVTGGSHFADIASPVGVWERVAHESPDQALGFPMIAWTWGQLVGTSEFASRTVALLAGLLAMAIVYRTGAIWFSREAGLGAAAALATSLYFITFMHKFRVYTLAALAVCAALYFYGRLVFMNSNRPRDAVGFVLAGTLLGYSNYFAAPFAAVLGLYHLLFAPKNRRWWLPVGLAVVVALLFSAQVPVLLRGFAFNQEREALFVTVLSPLGILNAWTTYFSNGWPLLWLPVAVGAVWALVQPERRPQAILVWFALAGTIAAVVALNAAAGVFRPERVRYLMAASGPSALLVGLAVYGLGNGRVWAGRVLLVTWAGVGVIVTLDDTLMTLPTGDEGPQVAWREVNAIMGAQGEPSDGLLFTGTVSETYGYYSFPYTDRRGAVATYHFDDWKTEQLSPLLARPRIWWVRDPLTDTDENRAYIQQQTTAAGYVDCGRWHNANTVSLDLLAQSAAYCPGGEPLLAFADWLTLTQIETEQTADALTLHTGWRVAPAPPPETFSVGFHLFDTDGTLVTQTDVGLGAADGPYTPLAATVNLTGLVPGDYMLRLVAYNWRTGERLPGGLAGEPLTPGYVTLQGVTTR